MRKETDLQEIIKTLEARIPADNVIFSLNQWEEDPNICFVKANKAGLLRYTVELLKAADNYDEALEDGDLLYLTDTKKWLQGDVEFAYIEPFEQLDAQLDESEDVTNRKDKLIVAGCIAVLVLGFILSIVGLVAIINWF